MPVERSLPLVALDGDRKVEPIAAKLGREHEQQVSELGDPRAATHRGADMCTDMCGDRS